MSNKKIETVATTAGKLKKVTLEQFLEEVKVEKAQHLFEQYNAQIENEHTSVINVPAQGLPNEEDTTYIRSGVVLVENSVDRQLLTILDQVDFFNPPVGTQREDKTEAAAVYSMENFGVPTHLVEITYNCLGMFCIDDFRYRLLGPLKGAIICFAPRRNVIFRSGW